jgi:hypothetical protein
MKQQMSMFESEIKNEIESSNGFDNETRIEIQSSKVHWSELQSTCNDNGKQVVKDLATDLAMNREIFQTL